MPSLIRPTHIGSMITPIIPCEALDTAFPTCRGDAVRTGGFEGRSEYGLRTIRNLERATSPPGVAAIVRPEVTTSLRDRGVEAVRGVGRDGNRRSQPWA